jgi:hypothetical protein
MREAAADVRHVRRQTDERASAMRFVQAWIASMYRKDQ